MQIISGKIVKSYSKFIGQILTRKNKKICNQNFWTREIIENLKEAEKEIDEGKLISAKAAFKELRDMYGY